MLYTGLTYCGHPLACAAGVAALAGLRGRGPDRALARARRRSCWRSCERCRRAIRVIGDVRGGHGLFAVIELVADRDTRAPLAPWPQTPPALKALVEAAMAEGVSFATRGNLILLAPPLVIAEHELADALALLDRLLDALLCRPTESREPHAMSFRLTYATMFNPPEAMHERFEAALARVSAPASARRHALFIDGADRDAARPRAASQPDRQRPASWASSRSPTPPTSMRRCRPRTPRSRPGARCRSPNARGCCARSAT